MAIDFSSIRKKNIEGYGKYNHHLSYFADIYSTQTHFIWELLQNTEDALSRRPNGCPEGYVDFNLLEYCLEVRHNGMPFQEDDNQKDVSGICGIAEGTKGGDYTQIGKFGIGFKSVYAYTFLPQIHSGDEHFEIRRFVEPHGLNANQAPAMQEGETCIVLPFDSKQNLPDWAFRKFRPAEEAAQEIGNALRNIGVRSLLFLQHLTEIRWRLPDGSSGHFLRELVNETPSSKIVKVTNGDILEEWQVYNRVVTIQEEEKPYDILVEVAFLLEQGKVRRATGSELVVYFPTEKQTGLGFLIQAPFITTKARDNIKFDDPSNLQMIEAAAKLSADSLGTMRDNDQLDLLSFNALPLEKPEDSFFNPVYENIRKALKEQSILPSHDGRFIKAEEAKLARGAGLTELISNEQLGNLLGIKKTAWLDPRITENGPFQQFHAYIAGRKLFYNNWEIQPLIEGIQIDANSIASRMNSEFLSVQDISWLIKLISYIQNNSRPFKEKRVPFLRLQNGEHTSLPTESAHPTAYFPPNDKKELDLSSFPILAQSLAENKEIKDFLVDEGIHEIDELAIIEQCILPKYLNGSPLVEEHKADMEKILHAYETSSLENKKRLIEQLKESPLVRETKFGDNEIIYRKPNELYLYSDEINTYFTENETIAFVNQEYNQDLLEIIKEAGALEWIRIDCKSKNGSAEDVNLEYKDGYRKGLKGFDPDIKVDGLKYALLNPSKGKSQIIWNKIAVVHSRCIKGEVLTSSRQDFSPHASIYKKNKMESENFGKLLINNAWLPSPDGTFVRPSELNLDDLPESFTSDKNLADQLGMHKDIFAEFAKKKGFSVKDIDDFMQHRDEFKKWKAENSAREEKPEFPEKKPKNRDRREKKGKERLNDATEKNFEKRTRSVRTSKDSEAKIWLREKYTNNVGQLVCQICEDKMPFKKRDGEYYFLAVEMLSKDRFNKERNAQSLALCPVCAAMFKEFVRDKDDVEQTLIKDFLNTKNLKVPLHLGELNTSIRFREDHFIDLKVILEEQK